MTGGTDARTRPGAMGLVPGAGRESASGPDIRDHLRILRKRWRLISLLALLSLGVATLATLQATPQYRATTQLFVSAVGGEATATSAYQGSLFTQQRVKSYSKIVTSPPVTSAVVKALDLPETPAQLAEQVSAQAPPDTVLIDVSVQDPSALRAQRIANAMGAEFTRFVNDLETPAGGGASPVKVSVVSQAGLPASPVSPRKRTNLTLGLLVGLALGVGAATLRERLDTSVKDLDTLQGDFGLSALGVIAFDPEADKRPLIVQAAPHSTRSEAFRQLRTNLQFVDIDHAPASIVFTSSVPQEGKSTTTCNLAITLAQAGVSVILVDADLRRPQLASYLGIEGAVGLTDVLIGRVALDDVLQPWGDGFLDVLPSGPTPPNPSELLGTTQMAELIQQLEQRCDLVLIDAPPLLPVTDAAVLSTIASGAVLVVRAASTRHEQVQRALQTLDAVGAQVFGAVLNMTPSTGPDAYRYGYGYGYGYGPAADVETRPEVNPTGVAGHLNGVGTHHNGAGGQLNGTVSHPQAERRLRRYDQSSETRATLLSRALSRFHATGVDEHGTNDVRSAEDAAR